MAGKRRQRERIHSPQRAREQRPTGDPTAAEQGTTSPGATPPSPSPTPATTTPLERAPSHRTLADATSAETAIGRADAQIAAEVAQASAPEARALARGNEGGAVAPRRPATSTAILIRGAKRPPRHAARIVPRRTGPRSAAAQFASAMVVVIAVGSVVALASPLGSATGLTQTFQAYANAIPFIPTPTPTPRPAPQGSGLPPHSTDPGKQAIIDKITAVFGPYAQGALNVARCESGYDPNSWNPYPIGNSHASGVFQILYPSTWSGTAYASYSPFNADANIRAAYQIFQRDGYSWREWACQP